MFYLMPLGHADFLHSAKLWLGLIFVLFPLSFLLYGVNDIVDAETDALNPRKGTFMFGARGAREQLASLKWQIAVAQIPFAVAFYFLVGPRILVWYAALLVAVGLYNAPLADFLVWRNVCDALSHFRRSDGHRARPLERPANYGDGDRKNAREIPDRSVSVR